MQTIDVGTTFSLLTNISPMSEREAREAVTQINQGVQLIRGKLLELQKRRGWEALGYESWKQFCEQEFDSDRRRLNYMLQAAVVESELIDAGIHQGKIFPTPDSQLRAIGKAPAGKRKEAFLKLKEWEQEDGRVTEQDAELAVAVVYPNVKYELTKKLIKDFIEAGEAIPQKNCAAQIFNWMKKNGHPLTERHKKILGDSIEEYLQEEAEPIVTPAATSISAKTQTEESGQSEHKALVELASYLNNYEPRQLAEALKFMDEEFTAMLILKVLPALSPKVALEQFEANSISHDELLTLANAAWSLGEGLDDEYKFQL